MRPAALALLLLPLTACTDLPPGWEDAQRVPDVVQTECTDGDPYSEDPQERMELAVDGDELAVDYLEAHFRCAQDVEVFQLTEAGSLKFLVQPVDMNPNMVAACDCLYDVSWELQGLAPGDYEVSLYRRWDNINDDNQPVPVGEESVLIE